MTDHIEKAYTCESREDLMKKLNPALKQQVLSSPLPEVKSVDPFTLLDSRRFDLLAKYIYAKYRELNVRNDWHCRLYLEHIKVFNGFVESDGSGKSGKGGFLGIFDDVLDEIKNKGFDGGQTYIPVASGNLIQDGAHRLAACMLYSKSPVCAFFDVPGAPYDFQWFRSKGLSEKWLDAMALELCRINRNCFTVVVYPTAEGKDKELVDLVQAHGAVWYRKSAHLKGHGPLNLIRQIYRREPWLGTWKDGFAGAQNKASWCFRNHGPVRVFVVESTLKRMQELKVEIRKLYAAENHSVHINDTHEETVEIAELLLNENSIHFMNNSSLKEFKWFNRLIGHYIEWLGQNGQDRGRFCIGGSAVLAAYGIREARDIDFLHLGEKPSTGFKEISSHNSSESLYGMAADDIVTNPENHFYYQGVKFASLGAIRKLKLNRGEEKDRQDILNIDRCLKGEGAYRAALGTRFKRMLSPRFVYQQARFMALRARFLMTAFRRKRI